ncbi:MAG: thioredoxin family protein [Spirochaetales bacterium]|nr:thioredoxin family protein [Spirochaetales bacterium]
MKVFTIYFLAIATILIPLAAEGQKEDMAPENSMMAMENSSPMNDTMGMEGEPFITYKNPEQAMMLAEEKPTVLFFNASWCPDCRAAREDFLTHKSSLTDINLILVDYDDSDDLKMKYGVTYQHTFVLIDGMGKSLDFWNGGGTEELLAHVSGEGM